MRIEQGAYCLLHRDLGLLRSGRRGGHDLEHEVVPVGGRQHEE